MSRVKTHCSHNFFQALTAWGCVSAGTKKLFSLLSVTSYSSFAFHKVSVTIYNSECWLFARLRSSFSPTACATRHWFFSLSLPPVSNIKNIDPGKFPLHHCYCLNNVTNDLTGGYTKEVGNWMCLWWIISFGAEGCSLNSADLILVITTTTLRSTAITHDEWLLWLHDLSLRWLHSASQSGMEPSVKCLAWSDWKKASLSSLEYKLEHRRHDLQCMIHHLGHFFCPEITHRRWARASLHQQTPETSMSPRELKSKDWHLHRSVSWTTKYCRANPSPEILIHTPDLTEFNISGCIWVFWFYDWLM